MINRQINWNFKIINNKRDRINLWNFKLEEKVIVLILIIKQKRRRRRLTNSSFNNLDK